MDEAYWKERCAAAEAALAKARKGLPLTDQRRRVLEALGNLKPSESIDTNDACQLLRVNDKRAYSVLSKMHEVGLVERTPGQRGIGGAPSRWRLGYLVQLGAGQ